MQTLPPGTCDAKGAVTPAQRANGSLKADREERLARWADGRWRWASLFPGRCPGLEEPPPPWGGRRKTVPFAKGFTLIELLVVIIIIGILAGLITAAAIAARRRAIIASIVTDVKQLEAACTTYQSDFGEFPPDFANVSDVDTSGSPTAVAIAAQQAVLRHLAKRFPRYVPGVAGGGTGWAGFVADLKAANGWNMDVSSTGISPYFLSPAGALCFWLGGKPDWLPSSASGTTLVTLPDNSTVAANNPVRGFLGFSANPLNPFDNSTSRSSAALRFRRELRGCGGAARRR